MSEDNKIIYGGYENIDQFGNRTGMVTKDGPSGFITASLIRKNPISVGSVLIDKSLLEQFRFDEKYEITITGLSDFRLIDPADSVKGEIAYITHSTLGQKSDAECVLLRSG